MKNTAKMSIYEEMYQKLWTQRMKNILLGRFYSACFCLWCVAQLFSRSFKVSGTDINECWCRHHETNSLLISMKCEISNIFLTLNLYNMFITYASCITHTIYIGCIFGGSNYGYCIQGMAWVTTLDGGCNKYRTKSWNSKWPLHVIPIFLLLKFNNNLCR